MCQLSLEIVLEQERVVWRGNAGGAAGQEHGRGGAYVRALMALSPA